MKLSNITFKVSLIVVMLVVGSGGLFAADYNNLKYSYSIFYPTEFLTAGRELTAEDGIVFTAKTGKAEFRVYGSYNVLHYSPRKIADEGSEDCPAKKASYRVVKPTLVAVSCETKSEIIYQKTLIKDERLVTFGGRYPKSERVIWDAVTAQMARKFYIWQPTR